MSLEIITSTNLESYLDIIADFRIKYFKEFPYLYEGTIDYEKHYLQGFAKDPKSILILIKFENRVIAVSTALPLMSEADILDDTSARFKEAGYQPEDFFYYSEVLIAPDFRKEGLLRKIYAIREKWARSFGFNQLTLATVIREKTHPLRPSGYVEIESIWKHFGFQKTSIEIDYKWPTIFPDGSVKEVNNKMVFWHKAL